MHNLNNDNDGARTSLFKQSPNQEFWAHIEKIRYDLGIEKEAWANLLQLSLNEYESMQSTLKSPKLVSIVHLCSKLGIQAESVFVGKVLYKKRPSLPYPSVQANAPQPIYFT